MNLKIGKEYYCAHHDIGKTKLVEDLGGDVLVIDYRCKNLNEDFMEVAVPSRSLFEKIDENFELEKLAFRLNRREATGYDLIALIAKTIKMIKE